MLVSENNIITFGKPDGHKDLHIGHLSGVAIYADVYSRCLRNLKRNAYLISGTDGYGSSVFVSAFKNLGHIPSHDELRVFVLSHHLSQIQSLSDFSITPDFYGNDTDTALTALLENKCDEIIDELINKNVVFKKDELVYIDPVFMCPLGKRDIKKLTISNQSFVISLLTMQPALSEMQTNWFLPIEQYRNILENSLIRFDNSKQCYLAKKYVQTLLKSRLPDYRITSHQPWALSSYLGSGVRYQVWFGSLVATFLYGNQFLDNDSSSEIIHFIGEDTLFFYTIIEPIIWQLLHTTLQLPQIFCARTRSITNSYGERFFPTADELVHNFDVDKLRICFSGRGSKHSNIQLSEREINRLWKGYRSALMKCQNNTCCDSEVINHYISLIIDCEFSKAADYMDEYFHSNNPSTEVLRTVLSITAPGLITSYNTNDNSLEGIRI